jgi:hypothetical protein
MANVGKVEVEIVAKDKFSKSLDTANKKVDSFAKTATQKLKNFTVAIAGVYTTIRAFGQVMSGVNLAGNFEKDQNKLKIIFGENIDLVNDYIKTLSKATNTSYVGITKSFANTADILKGIGFDDRDVVDSTTRVQELGIALAKFTNVQGGAEEASRILTRAMLGERDALTQLGIKVLEDDVLLAMKSDRYKDLAEKSTTLAKAQIVLDMAYSQSQSALKALNSQEDVYANNVIELKSRLKDLGKEISEKLMPVINNFVKGLNNILETVQSISFDNFNKLKEIFDEKMENRFVRLLAIITSIKLVVMTLGKPLGSLNEAFLTLAKTIAGFAGALFSVPTLLLMIATGAGIYVVGALNKMGVSISDVFGYFVDTVSGVWDTISPYLERIVNDVKKVIGFIFEIPLALAWIVTTAIQSLGNFVAKIFEILAKVLDGAQKTINSANKLLPKDKKINVDFTDTIDKLNNLKDFFKNDLMSFDQFKDKAKKGMEKVGDLTLDKLGDIKGGFKKFVSDVKTQTIPEFIDTFTEGFDVVSEKLKNVIEKSKDTTKNLLDNITGKVKGFFGVEPKADVTMADVGKSKAELLSNTPAPENDNSNEQVQKDKFSISSFAGSVLNAVPSINNLTSAFKEASTAEKGFAGLTGAMAGFANIILQLITASKPFQMFTEMVSPIIQDIANILGAVLMPVFNILAGALRALADVVVFIYEKVLRPVANGIIKVFNAVFIAIDKIPFVKFKFRLQELPSTDEMRDEKEARNSLTDTINNQTSAFDNLSDAVNLDILRAKLFGGYYDNNVKVTIELKGNTDAVKTVSYDTNYASHGG